MKILSFGDTHIGADCDEDVRDAIGQIAHKAREVKPDLAIITGDIYDGSSTPDHRLQAAEMVTDLAGVCPVFVIKGNHDIKKDLEIFRKVGAGNEITVFEQPGMVCRGDMCLHILPWFSKSGWIANQSGINESIADSDATVSQMALTYLKGAVASHPDKKHVIFGHLLMAGSRLENHQPLLGDGITFGYHDLVEAGFTAGAFGHIHLAQSFGGVDGSPTFLYNGSVAALNYGETAANKTFSVLNTDTMKFDTYQIITVQRMTFNANYNGAVDDDFKASIATEIKVLPGETLPVRVRVKLIVDEGYSSEDARKAVREHISVSIPAGCIMKDLKIDVQRKPKDFVRAMEIASARTACQKMEAYWSATNTTPDEPMRSDMLGIVSEIEAELSLR